MKYKNILFCFFTLSLFVVSAQENQKKDSKSFKIIEKVPVFPGCNGSKKELKNCFSKNIQMHFAKKFNIEIVNNLGLKPGKIRVFIGFQIDKFGDINDMKVRAPHTKIEEECIRVMKQLPKVIPGEIDGETVDIKYSIPFTIFVEETKEQKKERKRKERELKRNKN